jgi:pimeloyl-ACP methyl ester carboxylesterase
VTRATEATITAKGLRLFVREQGAGHPLLMINGIATGVERWGRAERMLAAGSRTIVFDSPGTGRSETSLYPRSLPALADTVVSLLDELGHTRVDVLGFSFGGALAQQLAKDAPARLRRLALVSTMCGWGAAPCDLGALVAAGYLGPDVANPLGCAHQLWAFAGWSSLPWLGEVRAPTLVVSGLLDRLVPPSNAVQLAGLLPKSRLHLLPGAGHSHLVEGDGAGTRLLADFFSSASLARSKAWTTGVLTDKLVEEAA